MHVPHSRRHCEVQGAGRRRHCMGKGEAIAGAFHRRYAASDRQCSGECNASARAQVP